MFKQKKSTLILKLEDKPISAYFNILVSALLCSFPEMKAAQAYFAKDKKKLPQQLSSFFIGY
ncbi:MAG TPA: hypothetical protein DHU90_16765 [Sphingobacterium sp.]|uniref:Uncharacterized protein n=1 Tax=Sphingobacterium multivorum TaxID=28454 RepID=A0A654DSW4_SPHMU|nr:hypothetical protein HMPREF3127_16385 [Sphingobacterium sp. HMSC13C05]VXD08569.1 conserved hypothetical protein [Sphingobacterium multivorum]HAF37291.1 hypothetical protein [Sphingobacterium sp.]HAL53118.1 hypothetical protein [Sphingobacterium sp.]HCX58202.1 hypothetical protein [Sphingobacterium sp.]